jgi:psp operon transcriptional activator
VLLPTHLSDRLAEVEQELLQAAMDRARFNQRVAADLLGLSYDQLRGKLRKFGIARNSGS